MLNLSDINVDLAGNRILRDVSASFDASKTIGIVGRNGAGKTTLLRTIMGLTKIKSGKIMFDGADLSAMPGHKRAALKVGYAPEDRVIFPTMTVQENLNLPCEVQGQSKTDIAARIQTVLKVVPQLEPMLGRSGSALSGGQGKMVALARAIMVGTRLLMLDEPFQGLAPKLARDYTEALERLKELQPELCVVITESNVKLLGGIPDQIWTIERGSITLN
ncbi:MULTISPECIES: ABC transporter ATP-binding protein [Achromobacter]|jgi:branched-chain amino acid transport system ATP-binding protein|uniref:ATP-binding cassette domain-containing protein n=1 Tax=Achromobacter spanius TaxID=217203 RepID=A0AA42LUI0_9BURK|nr:MULTISPECIES: ATP-binding cassette domain-containing protein [Achromobacter]MCS3507378.1 branched-chain amino acid transport system ATP-binding protein [Achromobacter sp. JUb104]MDH0739680.1 ATP-binding cassette domain-containing protein [Achromobacter spanius]WAI84899.1 ATP-binding cassette domain-containing protein [Achromobacter spanius]WEX94983.1 ATP-binding cassette domain-containing protein [Achromobacter sp. SS2-2022]WFP05849.1 ATP-binding cassette domain-containing protein [Achromob